MPTSNRPPSEQNVARAFVDVQRVLDHIRRGEIHASAAEKDRLTEALNALRDLRLAA